MEIKRFATTNAGMKIRKRTVGHFTRATAKKFWKGKSGSTKRTVKQFWKNRQSTVVLIGTKLMLPAMRIIGEIEIGFVSKISCRKTKKNAESGFGVGT